MSVVLLEVAPDTSELQTVVSALLKLAHIFRFSVMPSAALAFWEFMVLSGTLPEATASEISQS